jgi:hypothetical protein
VIVGLVATIVVIANDDDGTKNANTRDEAPAGPAWKAKTVVRVGRSSPFSYDQLAFLTVNGDVPREVAAAACNDRNAVTRRLVEDDPHAMSGPGLTAQAAVVCNAQVTASPNPAVGVLEIEVSAPTSEDAAAVARRLGDSLIGYVRDTTDLSYRATVKLLDTQLARAAHRVERAMQVYDAAVLRQVPVEQRATLKDAVNEAMQLERRLTTKRNDVRRPTPGLSVFDTTEPTLVGPETD